MPSLALYTLDASTGVAMITLNRPDKRNALNPALIEALQAAFEKAENDEGARVIVLNANGKDFCAGADLAHLETTLDWSHDELVADAMLLGNLFIHMRGLPRPIIAAVHGNALAGGCGLATACDLIVAAEDARFGYPEVHIGFVPAMVMTMLIRSVGEKVAYELVATGRKFGAEEAKGMGLVNRVVGRNELVDQACAWGAELAKKPVEALGVSKDLLHTLGDLSFVEGMEVAASVNAAARTSEEAREGFRRFFGGGEVS